jgi:hypothetical protein
MSNVNGALKARLGFGYLFLGQQQLPFESV